MSPDGVHAPRAYIEGVRELPSERQADLTREFLTAVPRTQHRLTMTGRGQGGKGVRKGGDKRHRKVLREIIRLIYKETRGVLKVFLENVIRDAVTYTEHAKRRLALPRHQQTPG